MHLLRLSLCFAEWAREEGGIKQGKVHAIFMDDWTDDRPTDQPNFRSIASFLDWGTSLRLDCLSAQYSCPRDREER